MTYAEIKNLVMFQTNNDADDLGDYLPQVNTYVNEGYEELILAYASEHLDADGDYPPLRNDSETPLLPIWSHKALADWATWCIYRNGNPQKQQRGSVFKEDFDTVMRRIRGAGGSTGITTPITAFTNLPD